MPEEPRNPRSIDERLDAIAMTLELQIRETEMLRDASAADRLSMGEFRVSMAEFRESLMEFRSTVLPVLENLLKTSLSHETACSDWNNPNKLTAPFFQVG